MELFQQGKAFARNVGLRAGGERSSRARPDWRYARRLTAARQKSTPALLFQSVFSACVAPPAGLVGILKMEGDN